jgi:hypothetical protein
MVDIASKLHNEQFAYELYPNDEGFPRKVRFSLPEPTAG